MIDFLTHTQLWIHLSISVAIVLAAVILWRLYKNAYAKYLTLPFRNEARSVCEGKRGVNSAQ